VLLILRLVVHRGVNVVSTVGMLLALVGWLFGLAVAGRRVKAMATCAPPPVQWELPLMALTIVGFGLLGVALVVFT
jgi:hypothetical protein